MDQAPSGEAMSGQHSQQPSQHQAPKRYKQAMHPGLRTLGMMARGGRRKTRKQKQRRIKQKHTHKRR